MQMDARFVHAVERAIARGKEHVRSNRPRHQAWVCLSCQIWYDGATRRCISPDSDGGVGPSVADTTDCDCENGKAPALIDDVRHMG